jgi:hypothetical protein
MDIRLLRFVLAGLMWGGGGLLVGTALILYFVDRHALSHGRLRAFRRGVRIASRRFQQFGQINHTAETIRTAQGEGRWLTEEEFGFWAREDYSYGRQAFAWVGLAVLHTSELHIEVRLLRMAALRRLAALCMCVGLPLTFAGGDFGIASAIASAGVSAFALRRIWMGYQRERRVAEAVIAEFGTRLQQGR